MRILAIETSCDETAAAIIENGTKVLASTVATSIDMHRKTGGIIPENAAREQIVSIIPVITETLAKSMLYWDQVDALAVTFGPGLIGSLLVGVETAKTLSLLWKKPIVPANHLVAHIYANWIDTKEQYSVISDQYSVSHTLNTDHRSPSFPAIALVVSGGHTDLVCMESHQKITWIGGTRDDAAGEAFDKTARLLGLPYPGGPSISKAAEIFFIKTQNTKHKTLNLFPRPMIDSEDLDMSFSGLKTAVSREINSLDPTSLKLRRGELSAQVQEAIVDVLISKSISAIKKYHPRSFLLAGGVAANKRLKEKFQEELAANFLSVSFHVPNPILCTDNAVFIGSRAYFDYNPIPWNKIDVNPELTISS